MLICYVIEEDGLTFVLIDVFFLDGRVPVTLPLSPPPTVIVA